MPTENTVATAPTTDLTHSTDPRSQAAYNDLLAPALALPSDSLLQVNLDLPTTATTCIAIAERMTQHRASFALLPQYDMAAFDGLETAGLALLIAQADYRAAVAPTDSLPELVERGTVLRASLQLWGDALAHEGLLNSATANAIRGGASYRDLAVGLASWVRAYRAADWERIKRTTTLLTDAVLAEAETIAQRIFAVVGHRDMNPEKAAAASDIRQRMFTIAVQRYDEVRRGATYLRWHEGDVDEFVPSLFVKGPRKPEKDDKDDKATGPGTPAQPPSDSTSAPVPPARPAGEPGTPNSRPFLNR